MKRDEEEKRGARMNPKVKIIIEEFFPKIIETHIRTRSSIETTQQSLDRYRTMGLQVIRNLPVDAQQEDKKALDQAYKDAIERLDEFHSRETSSAGASLPEDTPRSH